jgi:hypothetical protein
MVARASSGVTSSAMRARPTTWIRSVVRAARGALQIRPREALQAEHERASRHVLFTAVAMKRELIADRECG